MPIETIAATRLRSLDGLRGIAAVVVMSYHFNIFFLPQSRLNEILPLSRAYLAVDLFFLLSGFVMAHVYGCAMAADWQRSWSRFAIARFARIYPLFALTVLALVAIVSMSDIVSSDVSFSAEALWLYPFLLQCWHYGLSWNYPSWSIATEAMVYLIFVFTARILIRAAPWPLALCCIGILTALCVAKGGHLDIVSQLPGIIRTLAGFFLGVLLYRASLRDYPIWRRLVAALSLVFAAIAALTGLDIFIIGSFAGAIYYSVGDNGIVGAVLNSAPLRALGKWSYGIYLWHAPVHFGVAAASTAMGYALAELGLWESRLLALSTALGVIAISAGTFRYFEMPLRGILHRSGRSDDVSTIAVDDGR